MLKVEWGMLNSHFSSLSLAGVRRACPALKPDAADQVLLKNRAGFAAFSKGRAFHHVGNRIAARVTGRRGPAGPCPAHNGQNGRRGPSGRVAMPVSRDVSPRLIPLDIGRLAPGLAWGFFIIAGPPTPRDAGWRWWSHPDGGFL